MNDHDSRTEMTDAELEAIAGGKTPDQAFKLDAFNNALSRPRGSFGNLARRPLPGRGGRIASNASTSGQGYA